MRVAELFRSIQGEGEWAGTPSVFVRTTGCNLRCVWCDTPYTSWEPAGAQRPWQEVCDEVLACDERDVVVTGGEPMLQPDVVPLTQTLADRGRRVTIETAGTVFRPVEAALISISPKLSNSDPRPAREPGEPSPGAHRAAAARRWRERHRAARHRPDVVRALLAGFRYQLKFVIEAPDDLEEMLGWLDEFPQVARDRVWVMPQAVTAEQVEGISAWLEPAAERLAVRYSSRLQILEFGNLPGR